MTLSLDPSPATDGLNLVHTMVLARVVEEKLRRLYLQGKLRGRLISGRGQEAIPVGAATALRAGDVIGPVHRDLGAHLARGTTPLTIFRHYLGRVTGPSRGRDGDIHMGEWSRGVFPMVSHLPDSWPVLGGVALGFKLEGNASIALALCGDGATSTGTWHESVNFASVFQLPIVYVVENNQYAYSTPVTRQFRGDGIAARAANYGVPGLRVDGNDVFAVRKAVDHAAERARMGDGPTLIEAMTMRMEGHAVHDDASYVPPDLLAEWQERDPIERAKARLSAEMGPQTFADDYAKIVAEVEAAYDQASKEPLPEPGDLLVGVYADHAQTQAGRREV